MVKHAGTCSATLEVRSGRESLTVSVSDDGNGADLPDTATPWEGPSAGIGLRGIRERIRAIGGRVDFESAPGHGCRVRLTVPVR